MNGWTPERRKRQSELVRRWRPWENSTGPRTREGKKRVARNAYKGGTRRMLRSPPVSAPADAPRSDSRRAFVAMQHPATVGALPPLQPIAGILGLLESLLYVPWERGFSS